jgi:hypothetical protein
LNQPCALASDFELMLRAQIKPLAWAIASTLKLLRSKFLSPSRCDP